MVTSSRDDRAAVHEVDVAVVGYGPVGATAANLLGAAGLSVVVLERETSIYSRARAISTDEEVLRLWQQTGLADELAADMLAEKRIDFVDARGESFIDFRPVTRGNGHPPQLFLYQPALEQTLRRGVERYPNVQVWTAHECFRVSQHDDGVDLTVADLAGATVKRVSARYVIAADGGSSPTRAQLAVGFEGRTYEDRWLVIDTLVRREWPEIDRLRFHCDPQRPAVDCPTPLGHHRWEFPVLPGEDEEQLASSESVWRLLGGHGITDEHVEVLRSVVYSHHVRFASRWRVGRVFLAGDAAHVMPPWIGEGMASGVRDAVNLCWKLAGVVRGELADEVLDTYETERQPHVREMTRDAVWVGRVITERRRAVAWLRDRFFRAAMTLPLVGDYVRRGSWFPDPHYRVGLLAEERSPALGWLPPQPWVLDEHGGRRRFDDARRSGWTVVCTGDPVQAVTNAWTGVGAEVTRLLVPHATPRPRALVDTADTLRTWMREHDTDTVVLRPDGFVYAAGSATRPCLHPRCARPPRRAPCPQRAEPPRRAPTPLRRRVEELLP